MQLDYSLSTPEDRIACVEKLLAETPPEKLTKGYLSYMSDYILFIADRNQTKIERKAEKPILTKNREVTINKRQESFEKIVSSLENGEDGIYALISDNKNQILDPKDPISEEDILNIPEMQAHLDLINRLKLQLPGAKGMQKYYLKKTIIETYQQMYILKASYKAAHGMRPRNNGQIKTLARTNLDEHITFDEKLLPQSDGVLSLLNANHISYLLCFYSKLKEESYDDLQGDMHWLLIDLEKLIDQTLLENYPLLYDIVIWKIDGLTNEQIQEEVDHKYGEWHSEQYYSSLWRKRIPNLLLEQAQKNYVIWYYTNEEKGYWKTCTKCGSVLPGHPLFYNKNSSKDGFYSQCRSCRSTKRKG